MTNLLPRTPAGRGRLRTVLAGATCFFLGSAVLGYAAGSALPPGLIHGIADATDSSRTVRVSANGELSAADEGTRQKLDTVNAKLAPMAFEPDGSLKVAGTSEVSGHVSVDNLPAVQPVSGSVSVAGGSVGVSNLPSVYPVSGNVNVTGVVAVANQPAVQDVNVTGGAVSMELQPTSRTFDSGRFVLRNDNTKEDDYLNALYGACQAGTPDCPPPIVNSPKFQRLGLPSRPAYLTLAAINAATTDVHLLCLNRSARILRMAVNINVVREFVRPLEVTDCFLECVSREPDLGPPLGLPKCEGEYSLAGL